MPSFQDLPVELGEKIINYLQNDKAALTSCSLVNRTWQSFTRHHLFYRITLHPSLPQTPEYKSSQSNQKRILNYFSLVDYSTRCLVEELTLTVPEELVAQGIELTIDILRKIVKTIPNLRILILDNLTVHSGVVDSVPPLCGVDLIQKLVLRKLRLPYSIFGPFLSLFTGLKELHVIDVSSASPYLPLFGPSSIIGPSNVTKRSNKPTITTLVFDGNSPRLDLQHVSTLTSLSLQLKVQGPGRIAQVVDTATEIIKAACQTLIYIRLDYSRVQTTYALAEDIPSLLQRLPISSCTSLQSFAVRLNIHRSGVLLPPQTPLPETISQWAIFSSFLAQLPPSSIRTISVALNAPTDQPILTRDTLGEVDFDTIDQTLVGFRRLRSFSVWYERERKDEDKDKDGLPVDYPEGLNGEEQEVFRLLLPVASGAGRIRFP